MKESEKNMWDNRDIWQSNMKTAGKSRNPWENHGGIMEDPGRHHPRWLCPSVGHVSRICLPEITCVFRTIPILGGNDLILGCIFIIYS